MATEVEVAAVRDALELTELAFRPKRKGMVDIRSADRTVRPLALAMLPQLEFARGEVEIEMPIPAAVALGAISPGRVGRPAGRKTQFPCARTHGTGRVSFAV